MLTKIPIRIILFICFALFLFSSGALKSQFISVDSLENRLKRDLPETERVNILYQLSRELVYVDPSRALSLAEESRDLAIKIGSKIDEAYAYRIISSVYSDQNYYSLAMSEGLKSLHIFEAIGDTLGIANYYITLGNLYRIQNFHNKSAYYHRLSYEYFKTHGPEFRFAITALNYGEELFYLDSLEKAKKLLLQSITINNRFDNMSAQTFSYKAMGLIYNKLKQYDSAEYYFKSAIELSKKLGENSQKKATTESMFALANLYQSLNMEQKHLDMLKEVESYSLKYNQSKQLAHIYLDLMEYYAKMDNISETSRYISSYKNLTDSLENASALDRELMLSTVYRTIKVGVENEYLEKKQVDSNQLIYEQRIYLVLMTILAVLALLAIIFVLRAKRKLSRAYFELDKQKEQIKDKSEELEKLNETKDKIFSIVSHDLKSPLHSLLSFSELVKNHYKELSEKEIIEMMQHLNENVNATLKMTENLIEWGKLQMKVAIINPSSFDVNEICTELIEVYRANAEDKNIILINETLKPSYVYADYNHVHLIIRNLINNALKFTEKGGTVRVKAVEQKEITLIEVSDSGIGIDEEVLAKLFKLKTTTTVGTLGEKGTGLGLMLCNEYALKNQGNILVESTINEGSRFELRLPSKNPR
jgi:signal transduction histidine kinase